MHKAPGAGALSLVETDDGSLTYFNPAFDQTYHSIHGALTESLTVFINGSQYAENIQSLQTCQPDDKAEYRCTIVEVGFGLGLNFLLAADMATTKNISLTYHAVENALPTTEQLTNLDYGRHLVNTGLWDNLLVSLDELPKVLPNNKSTGANIRGTCETPTFDCLTLTPAERITLRIYTELNHLHALAEGSADYLFLDGFSPDSNPECWSEAMLTRYHQLLTSGGVLVTYSAKGRLRRQLQASGFSIQKCPGPPGKREFLRAIKSASTKRSL